MGSPKTRFRSSVRIVQIVHNFTHSGSVKDGGRDGVDSSDSESETERLCNGEEGLVVSRKSSQRGGWRLPRDIPHGYMAVYVGKDKKRFVISTNYLSHPLFKSLLKKSEEEFGFVYEGGLVIACEPVLFEHLLWIIGNDDPASQTTETELDALMEFYDEPQILHR